MADNKDKLKLAEQLALIQACVIAAVQFVFGTVSKKGEPVAGGWLSYADHFTCSSQEFYATVEEELKARKLPGVDTRRIEFNEFGLLSGQRTYLRLMRERICIDTCAAPFGRIFFFSCRIVHVPARIYLWHVVAAVLFFRCVFGVLADPLGPGFALIATVTLPLALAGVMGEAGSRAFSYLDALILRIPVASVFYQTFFREETYYRLDTRQLFTEVLPAMIRELAEKTAAAQGVTLVPHDGPVPVILELHQAQPPEPKE